MVFTKSKDIGTNVCVILISKLQEAVEMLVLTIEIYPVWLILWPPYILAGIFHMAFYVVIIYLSSDLRNA